MALRPLHPLRDNLDTAGTVQAPDTLDSADALDTSGTLNASDSEDTLETVQWPQRGLILVRRCKNSCHPKCPKHSRHPGRSRHPRDSGTLGTFGNVDALDIL